MNEALIPIDLEEGRKGEERWETKKKKKRRIYRKEIGIEIEQREFRKRIGQLERIIFIFYKHVWITIAKSHILKRDKTENSNIWKFKFWGHFEILRKVGVKM